MMVPSVAECFQLMEQYQMLKNIRGHSVVVARVAELISNRLRDAGFYLAPDVVIAAALLHDIGKTACLNTGERHDLKGREICVRHGFHEIADIVGEHVVLKNGVPVSGITEKEVVYYADKRVNHETIVPLEDRMSYFLKRYGHSREQLCQSIKRNFEDCRTIETQLFEHLDFSPIELPQVIRQFDSAI